MRGVHDEEVRLTGIISAVFLFIAVLLSAMHSPLGTGMFSQSSVPASAISGMGVGDQSTSPAVHNRSSIVVSLKPDRVEILKDAGGGHFALPPTGIELPKYTLLQNAASLTFSFAPSGIKRGYDACAPPALT